MAETLAETITVPNRLASCSSEDSRARRCPRAGRKRWSARDLSVDALAEPGHLTAPISLLQLSRGFAVTHDAVPGVVAAERWAALRRPHVPRIGRARGRAEKSTRDRRPSGRMMRADGLAAAPRTWRGV